MKNIFYEPDRIIDNVYVYYDYSFERDPWYNDGEAPDFHKLYTSGGNEGVAGLSRHKYVNDAALDYIVKQLNQSQPQVIVDAVCGPALLTFEVIKRLSYRPRQIVFVDISLIALNFIKQQFTRAFTDIESNFLLANAKSLPIKDGTVDFVLSFWGLSECFPYTEQCIKEINRVLTIGGVLYDLTFAYGRNTSCVKFFKDKAPGFRIYFDIDEIEDFYADTSLEAFEKKIIYEGKGRYLDVPNFPAEDEDTYKVIQQLFKKCT